MTKNQYPNPDLDGEISAMFDAVQANAAHYDAIEAAREDDVIFPTLGNYDNHKIILCVGDDPKAVASVLVYNGVIQALGSWLGHEEASFITTHNVAMCIRAMGLLDRQDCVMAVTRCNKQYCTLIYIDGQEESVGTMREVSEEVARDGDCWTRVGDRYFTTGEDNPDKTPPPHGWPNEHTVSLKKRQMQALAAAVELLFEQERISEHTAELDMLLSGNADYQRARGDRLRAIAYTLQALGRELSHNYGVEAPA